MVSYKLHLPKNTLYYSDTDGTNRTTWFDYWTTVKAENDTSSEEIIKRGKYNLKKQIAENELFNIALWPTIDFDNSEIEVIVEEK